MQLKLGDDFLPDLDAKRTKYAVIEAFEKYRICKYLTFEERKRAQRQGMKNVFMVQRTLQVIKQRILPLTTWTSKSEENHIVIESKELLTGYRGLKNF